MIVQSDVSIIAVLGGYSPQVHRLAVDATIGFLYIFYRLNRKAEPKFTAPLVCYSVFKYVYPHTHPWDGQTSEASASAGSSSSGRSALSISWASSRLSERNCT